MGTIDNITSGLDPTSDNAEGLVQVRRLSQHKLFLQWYLTMNLQFRLCLPGLIDQESQK